MQIGIIGGSGLDDPNFFKDSTEHKVKTPFGDPSDALICGKLNGIDCVLLARLLMIIKSKLLVQMQTFNKFILFLLIDMGVITR